MPSGRRLTRAKLRSLLGTETSIQLRTPTGKFHIAEELAIINLAEFIVHSAISPKIEIDSHDETILLIISVI